MFKFKTFAACLILLVFSLPSFAQSTDQLSYIPHDAQNIYVFNTASIIKKADINSIKELSTIKNLLSKTDAENNQFNTILKNPAESGLSFSKPLIMTISQIEGTTFKLINIIVPLDDAAKFSQIAQTTTLKVTENAGLNVSKGDSNAIAWNKQVAIFSSLYKKKEEIPMNLVTETDSTTADTVSTTLLPTLNPELLFQQSSSKNPRVDSIAALMRTPHDIYIYQNTDGTGKSPKAMMASMIFNLNPDDYNGNITSGWADFENGRIYGESHQRMNASMKEKFGNLFSSKPKIDWNKYISSAQSPKTIGTFAFAINPDGIKKLIEESPMMKKGLEKAENKVNKKSSMDEIFKTLGGDIFATAAMGEKEIEFLIGLSIKDRDIAKKILVEELKCTEIVPNLFKMADKQPAIDSTNTDEERINPAPKSNKPKPYILLKDDVVLLGNQAALDKIMSPTFRGSVATTDWQKALQNKSVNMYISLASIMNIGGAAASEKIGDLPIESMSMASGGNTTTFELKMVDKGKNALYSLVETLDKIAQKKAEQKRQLEEMMKVEQANKRKKDTTIPDDDN